MSRGRAALSVFAACLLSLFLSRASAFALVYRIDFSLLPDDTVVSNQYQTSGVVFSSGYVSPDFPGDPPRIAHPGYYGNGVVLDSYCNAPTYIQANFSIPVDFVSVELQPFEPGNFAFGLELYDSASTLLASTTVDAEIHSSIWLEPWGTQVDPNELVTLFARNGSSNVAFARFYGYSGYGVNAVSANNFSYGTQPVPEPATLVLLGSGLLGVLGRARRKGRG